MRTFGLIGYPLSHSFSEKHFQKKFQKENIHNTEYKLFPLKTISEFPDLLKSHPELCGLNVTIPYKETIIPFIDHLDETAKTVGAVNCIKIIRQKPLPTSTQKKGGHTQSNIEGFLKEESNPLWEGKERLLIGYNTDVYGFKETLKPFLRSNHEKALILGTGGAAKAVHYVLKQIGIECFFVSRTPSCKSSVNNCLHYNELTKNVIDACQLIVNATPVGMFPNEKEYPSLPYEYITSNHFLFDLIYNPEETVFLKKGKEKGAITQNGLGMFRVQAEKAWEIWNEE